MRVKQHTASGYMVRGHVPEREVWPTRKIKPAPFGYLSREAANLVRTKRERGHA